MTAINIRDNDACEAMYAAGWRWALTLPRGDRKGDIVSKHRSYDAAIKAARGRELMVSDLGEHHL